jgi:hypothetical protein
MKAKRQFARFVASLVACGALALAITGSASAKTGEWAKLEYCPYTNTQVYKCIHSLTTGGEVVMGKKTVPIVNPVTLQGGFGEQNEEFISQFYGATNGETLSKTPQPVPGGLSGLVNCKEISLGWLRESCEAVFENGLTGVNATLELARPASEIQVSEFNLIGKNGLALKLPVRVHLENPFLGNGCFIGSSAHPIIWNLTSGTTSPPPPNTPISGTPGTLEFIEEFEMVRLNGNELVDNAWSAPGATGCGGWPAEYVLDPIIEASVGVPAAAGTNTATMQNTILMALAEAVAAH